MIFLPKRNYTKPEVEALNKLLTAPRSFRQSIRRSIKEFEDTGTSGTHSNAGQILAYLLNYCVSKGYSFTLHASPCGYYLERVKEPTL